MRKWIKGGVFALGVVVLLIATWCVRYPFAELPLGASPVTFSISTGSSLRGAARQMVEAGVLRSVLPFEVLTRFFGDPRNIKAGNYEVEKGTTPLELMQRLTRGNYTALSITFVEG